MTEKILAGHMGSKYNPYQRVLEEAAALAAEGTGQQAMVAPLGQLGDENAMLEKLQKNELQLMVATSSGLQRLCPEIDVCDLPFLFPDRSAYDRAAEGFLKRYVAERLREKGVSLLGMIEGGERDLFCRERAIVEPKDLQGLKMRIMDSKVYQATMEELGAIPVRAGTKESYEMLRTGMLDGGDRGPGNYLEYGYDAVAPYYCRIGLFFIPSFLLASAEWMRTKTGGAQRLTEEAGRLEAEGRALDRKMDEEAMKKIQAGAARVTKGDRSQFLHATRGVRERVVKDRERRTVYEGIQAAIGETKLA